MNEIFADMEDVVVGYIDDLLIFTKSDNQEEHNRIVLEVLWWLEEHDLFVKPENCSFRVKEVEFLGMTVSAEGIKMNDDKVQAILEWPTPKTVRGVRSFLGLANFYWRFIKDYAQVARPLNDLTRKDQSFEWKDSQQTAFDMLKQWFTTAPILAFLDIDKQFCLETDASDFATGAVLSILKDDKWHPITYWNDQTHSRAGAVLEQGGDLRQWHSMADWEVSGKTLCGKSEDWEISKWTRLGGKPVECTWALYTV